METKNAPPQNGSIKKDVYAIVTERIIDLLNKGTVPWHRPWTTAGLPQNLISKHLYRGINIMLLACLGYERNLFLTEKQLKEIGGSVKTNERPHIVVYWNYIEETIREKKKALLRYYRVFNVAQCNGISENMLPPIQTREFTPIESCELMIDRMPNRPKIVFKKQVAEYDPLLDIVNMPKKTSFESEVAYYSTLMHELVHSTGHHSRLNRKDLIQMAEFGSEPYSHEELVAEIGSCNLLSLCGIENHMEQSAAYIQSWIKKLENDPKFIVTASTAAQKASDYILNIQPKAELKEVMV